MKKVLVVALFFSSFFGLASVQDSIGTSTENGKTLVQYMVSPGETIYRISSEYGVSISELMSINSSLENGLKVGQVLLIPYRPKNIQKPVEDNSSLSADHYHEVKPGETFYALSKKYNISVGDLLKWNGLELKAGQKLVVKNPNASTLPEPKKETPKTVTKTSSQSIEKKESSTVVYQNTEKPTTAEIKLENQANSTKIVEDPHSHKYHYNPNLKQVLIVPFDPHLYFSDADDEIAKESQIPRVHVREVFRRRLNALLDPKGYEVIHLMGGRFADTLTDLNKVYSSVQYNYQEILESPYGQEQTPEAMGTTKDENTKTGLGGWASNVKAKMGGKQTTNSKASTDRFEGKFFGVIIKDQKFFDYFSDKYSVDYYVFINQFEVITDYENCLDRSAHNYARYFIAHYTILDKDGGAVAGNKFKIFYNSNDNDVMKITADNMQKMSQKILNDLPRPDEVVR